MLKRLKSNAEASDTPSLRVRYLRAFGRDEDGGIIILTLLLLVIMLVMGGMAVDFMRYESRRALLQSVSDRAVLAAAELDQDLDSEQVVIEYFRSAGLEDAIVGTPTVVDTDGSRSVHVESQLDINTIYLRLIGIDQLDAPAESQAIEGTGNIEISLVLDISGSMGQGNKMQSLRNAATNFVTDLLETDEDSGDEAEADISISLVAYSQQVNIGEGLYRALNTTPDSVLKNGTLTDTTWPGFDNIDPDDVTTNRTRCVDFEPEHYATTEFDAAHTYQQVESFEAGNTNRREFRYPICPTQEQGGMILLSKDADTLTDAIADMVPTNTTSIHTGMKWGVSLLDPSMRPVLAGVPEIDPSFAGVRPIDHRTPNSTEEVQSIKYVILMTDGENFAGSRVRPQHMDNFKLRRGIDNSTYNYWAARLNNWNGVPNPNYTLYQPQNANQQDTWLQQTCLDAKTKGIIVFTIAMEAGSHGRGEMLDCATSPNYYFETESEAIDDVFESIAAQISHLRLSL